MAIFFLSLLLLAINRGFHNGRQSNQGERGLHVCCNIWSASLRTIAFLAIWFASLSSSFLLFIKPIWTEARGRDRQGTCSNQCPLLLKCIWNFGNKQEGVANSVWTVNNWKKKNKNGWMAPLITHEIKQCNLDNVLISTDRRGTTQVHTTLH